MKLKILEAVILICISACAKISVKEPAPQRHPQGELTQSRLFMEMAAMGSLPYDQRMGFLLEAADQPFKGCIIYLEGLGDSMRNHYPFFNRLANAGYRVLLFDYLGQGGSEGEMAWTRLQADGYSVSADYEIGTQAKFVWKRYSENNDPVYGRNCAGSPKRVMGWSTGGLAAYKLAHEKWADGYVLIAPGIFPRFCVGASANDCMANLKLDKVITEETLTTNKFSDGQDPHLDPIKPTTPMDAKRFATNLMTTAYLQAAFWKIDKSSKGLVFLSGKNDTYVYSKATVPTLKRNAPSFDVVTYEKALHEIDNEVPEIAGDMYERTIQFLDTKTGKK